MPSTETCSDLTSVDCYRTHICSWPKYKICTTLLYFDIRFPGNTLPRKHRLSLPLPVLSSSRSSPLSGQGLWRPRVSHKILLWARNRGRALWPRPRKGQVYQTWCHHRSVPDAVDYLHHDIITEAWSTLSFISLASLPSPTWQTREHPLPFQWLQHRRLLHASPHAFPTLLFIFSQK